MPPHSEQIVSRICGALFRGSLTRLKQRHAESRLPFLFNSPRNAARRMRRRSAGLHDCAAPPVAVPTAAFACALGYIADAARVTEQCRRPRRASGTRAAASQQRS
ncbi:hypothetical protein EBA01_06815 [Xanthomonas oryzae pv. oryzae]|nr:hypothetical protein C0L89_06820 [Xanthomonas oryzae pv. oryzae]AVU02204.1 hypothetical protein C0L90_06620 [Xanthomonas oryzae pv. oryzae]QBI11850.1 hypothetical protein EYR02_06905 [Xanthomonas oryzae pv. oryzae]QBI15407.1 hypothetical protein EYR03_06665 [Xanthomonas oryzae pv. oryzae]QBN25619.1 hypothetical protein EBA00_15610 [Xanthomonas oryzae pv. oryzae]